VLRSLAKKKKGFTMIELMVVVLILGLLTAIGIPAYSGAKVFAEQKIVETNLRMIDNAITLYYETGNTEKLGNNNMFSKLVPGYLKSEISGPRSATYSLSSDGTHSVVSSGNNEKIGGSVLNNHSFDTLPWKSK